MRNNLERLGANPSQQDGDLPQAVEQQSGLSFIVPTEHVALPSKGLFYPPNHPLHNQQIAPYLLEVAVCIRWSG